MSNAVKEIATQLVGESIPSLPLEPDLDILIWSLSCDPSASKYGKLPLDLFITLRGVNTRV